MMALQVDPTGLNLLVCMMCREGAAGHRRFLVLGSRSRVKHVCPEGPDTKLLRT